MVDVLKCFSYSMGAAVILTSCHQQEPIKTTEHQISVERVQFLNKSFEKIIVDHQMVTAGAAIIQNGKIAWTGYYGEQAPGIPATKDTMFNVASLAKTVTSEVIVKLVADEKLSFDETMSAYWVDPDLVDDTRHKILTPRIALTHKTGFLNWRFLHDDYQLKFTSEPGTTFGYSGEGMRYVARFVEKKFDANFKKLVSEHVLDAYGLSNMSVSPQDWILPRLALPVDANGVRQKPYCANAAGEYCTKIGEWSAADDLATTVEDYSNFMINVMNGRGISDELQKERLTIQTDTSKDKVLTCPLKNQADCPTEQGYGLGWEIFDFGDVKYVSHGGSDWSERALVYFDEYTHDGIVVFLNGPAGKNIPALFDALSALDPDSAMTRLFGGWLADYNAQMAAQSGTK